MATKPQPRHVANRKAFLVYGPPCSGKTTYVEKHAKPGDLVIDTDRLHAAISTLGSHDRDDDLKQVVFELRDTITSHIARGKWKGGDVWVVTCAAKRIQRQRWRRELGAEPVLIKCEYSTCIARAKRERPPIWTKYIDRWFYDYEADAT